MVFLFPCEILCLQRAEEAVGSLGFEQKAILSHLLWIQETKLGFSGRAVSALNCYALSPATRPWLNCDSSEGCFFYSGLALVLTWLHKALSVLNSTVWWFHRASYKGMLIQCQKS